MSVRPTTPTWGLLAEFETPEQLLVAARRARESGLTRIDGYTPFPVHGLDEALAIRKSYVPLIVLLGGIVGATTGLLLQYWVSVIAYPMNIGGRPLASWPAWVPVIFETMVLFASLSAVVGMIVLNELPMPYHPVFNVPGFTRASQDRFYLSVEAADPNFDRAGTRAFLESLGATEVTDVPH